MFLLSFKKDLQAPRVKGSKKGNWKKTGLEHKNGFSVLTNKNDCLAPTMKELIYYSLQNHKILTFELTNSFL